MIRRPVAVLSFICGFLSLSQEILWVRLISISAHSVPQAFAVVLGCFLIGIAYGAFLGGEICKRSQHLLVICGWLLTAAMLFDTLAPWLCVQAINSTYWIGVACLSIAVSAGVRSVAFPIVHHLGSQHSRRIGASVSNIYFANVMGATLGPILTGFFLLDLVGLQQAFLVVNAMTGLTGLVCLVIAGRTSAKLLSGALTMAVALLLSLPESLMHTLTTSPHGLGTNYSIPLTLLKTPNHLIENRQGVIQTYAVPGGDVVYGANVYDGTVNTDAHGARNGIIRAYMATALRPHARRILVIGLSTGAWARVLSTLPEMEQMDVVEINPGYVKLIAQYPEVAPLLRDPRVHIHIDDGRRWLRQHPETRYDLILMNTTWHWRSYSTLLLSHDFLEIVKLHMNPNALLYYNSTDSYDALYTAATVFNQALMYVNFIFACDRGNPSGLDANMARSLLARLRWPESGKPVFDMTKAADQAIADQMIAAGIGTPRAAEQKAGRPLEVITDQNMITEFKYGASMVGGASR